MISSLISNYKEELVMSDVQLTPNSNYNYCPICGSESITAIFTVPVTKIIPDNHYFSATPKNRCNSCGYEDEYGHFVILNKMKEREEKIDSILSC